MQEKLYQIKGIDLRGLKQQCDLDQWYAELVHKSIDELSMLDLSRMLRQEIFPDLAVPLVWNALIANPFAGEMYEGQLLEILLRFLRKHPGQMEGDAYQKFAFSLQHELEFHVWESDEDRIEYEKVVRALDKLFSLGV